MNIKVGDIVSYHDKDESESVRWYAIVTQINETIILVHGLDGGNTTAILPGEITAVWSCPEEMRAVKYTAFDDIDGATRFMAYDDKDADVQANEQGISGQINASIRGHHKDIASLLPLRQQTGSGEMTTPRRN